MKFFVVVVVLGFFLLVGIISPFLTLTCFRFMTLSEGEKKCDKNSELHLESAGIQKQNICKINYNLHFFNTLIVLGFCIDKIISENDPYEDKQCTSDNWI